MLLIALFPIYWMIITSVKSMNEIYSLYPTFWPQKITWSGYSYLFQKTDFMSWLMNSSIVSVIAALATMILSIPAAYGLSRFKFKGSNAIGNSILVCYLLPQTLIFIPVYILINKLGLASSISGLLLIYPSTTIPYATWMLTSYFSSIERDFDDAALMDGCSRLQLLVHILIPLTAPGIVSTFIFSFTICWGEYLFALVILGGSTKTLPLGLSTMLFGDVARWNTIMGGAIIASIPVIIIYILASKYIISGLSLGGVKG